MSARQRCAVYVSPRNWMAGAFLSPQELRAQVADCARFLDAAPQVRVVRAIASTGQDQYPFDAAFNELCGLVVRRAVGCIAVADIGCFAPSGGVALHWVARVMHPAGVRFIDAARGFDSLQGDFSAYVASVRGQMRAGGAR